MCRYVAMSPSLRWMIVTPCTLDVRNCKKHIEWTFIDQPDALVMLNSPLIRLPGMTKWVSGRLNTVQERTSYLLFYYWFDAIGTVSSFAHKIFSFQFFIAFWMSSILYFRGELNLTELFKDQRILTKENHK